MTTKEVEVKLKEYPILEAWIKNLHIDLEEYEEYGQTDLYNETKVMLAEREAKIKVLDDVLSTLSPEDYELIKLRYFRRYDTKYISEALGISLSGYNSRRNKILSKLAAVIEI